MVKSQPVQVSSSQEEQEVLEATDELIEAYKQYSENALPSVFAEVLSDVMNMREELRKRQFEKMKDFLALLSSYPSKKNGEEVNIALEKLAGGYTLSSLRIGVEKVKNLLIHSKAIEQTELQEQQVINFLIGLTDYLNDRKEENQELCYQIIDNTKEIFDELAKYHAAPMTHLEEGKKDHHQQEVKQSSYSSYWNYIPTLSYPTLSYSQLTSSLTSIPPLAYI